MNNIHIARSKTAPATATIRQIIAEIEQIQAEYANVPEVQQEMTILDKHKKILLADLEKRSSQNSTK